MKLKNIKEVEEFRKVIHTCTGDVYLKSQDGDVFNLKSALSEYIALGQLLSEQGDNLELFADKREDEAKLISFLAELDKRSVIPLSSIEKPLFLPEQGRFFCAYSAPGWRGMYVPMGPAFISPWSTASVPRR